MHYGDYVNVNLHLSSDPLGGVRAVPASNGRITNMVNRLLRVFQGRVDRLPSGPDRQTSGASSLDNVCYGWSADTRIYEDPEEAIYTNPDREIINRLVDQINRYMQDKVGRAKHTKQIRESYSGSDVLPQYMTLSLKNGGTPHMVAKKECSFLDANEMTEILNTLLMGHKKRGSLSYAIKSFVAQHCPDLVLEGDVRTGSLRASLKCVRSVNLPSFPALPLPPPPSHYGSFG